MSETRPLVLIVEDDEDMAELNARLLKRQGMEAITACSAAAARKAFLSQSPDILVLDIGLPDGDGLSLCEEFRKKADTPILFLTGRSDTADKVMGLGAGGDYYLTKPYDRNEFIAVVQSLLRRMEQTRKKIDEVTVIRRGSISLMMAERKAYVKERDAELTGKEFAVLLMLMQNENKELTGEAIYTAVWGAVMNNDANAVRLTISRLKRKLDEENAEDFSIFTIYGGGYMFTVI